MEALARLLVLYARYFVAVLVVGAVVLGVLWLASLRQRSRPSPGPTRAQTSHRTG